MTGCTSGPCPFCGAMGTVPDGAYQEVHGFISYIASLNATQKQLDAARIAILESILSRDTPDQARSRLIAAGPVGAGLLKFLGKKQVGTIIALLALMVSALEYIHEIEPVPAPAVNITVVSPPAPSTHPKDQGRRAEH